MASLTDTQATVLYRLYDSAGWLNSREHGVHGTTLEALERRGFAEARWVEKPYPHIEGRITAAGKSEVLRRHGGQSARITVTAAELDVLEGIVRCAEAGDRQGALATVEKLRQEVGA